MAGMLGASPTSSPRRGGPCHGPRYGADAFLAHRCGWQAPWSPPTGVLGCARVAIGALAGRDWRDGSVGSGWRGVRRCGVPGRERGAGAACPTAGREWESDVRVTGGRLSRAEDNGGVWAAG